MIFERPVALLAILLVIPAALIFFLRYRRLIRSLGAMYSEHLKFSQVRHLKTSLFTKFFLRALAWIFLVLAYVGISWGTRLVPVQKSGSAVSFVFDISYSMMARDGGNNLSRMEVQKLFASELLSRMEGVEVSIVLAKGDGIVAVPLTSDRSAIDSIIASLSPTLMTAAGSSLGKGVDAALSSFPRNSPQASYIWVFTDGDETDTGLSQSVENALRSGVGVSIIGFGSVKGKEVVAGDGKTKVKTCLQASKLRAMVEDVNRRISTISHNPVEASYEAAVNPSCAYRLLHNLERESDTPVFSYETQNVSHHGIFLLFSIIFFLASFIFSELNASFFTLKSAKASQILFVGVLSTFFFTSCSTGEKTAILKGAWSWYQAKYQESTAAFLNAYTNSTATANVEAQSYALFGLSATYLMQEEYDAAIDRIEQISPDANPQLRSAALYNAGIIANRRGDFSGAIELFKDAILANPENTDAKINLELSNVQLASKQSQAAQREMIPVTENKEDSSLEKGIFNLIKENEEQQWKKMQSNKKDDSTLDY